MSNVRIDIGSLDEVRTLFSYPNNFNEVGYLAQTLEKTIEIYLSSSVTRDGFKAVAVSAQIDAGRVYITLQGDAAVAYKDYLKQYLDAGRLEGSPSRVASPFMRPSAGSTIGVSFFRMVSP
jgi:hypothetical protein